MATVIPRSIVRLEFFDSHGYAPAIPYLTLLYYADDPRVQTMIAFCQCVGHGITLTRLLGLELVADVEVPHA